MLPCIATPMLAVIRPALLVGDVLADLSPQILGQLQGPGLVDLGSEDGELVSGQSRNHVGASHSVAEDPRHTLDQGVAGGMAEAVVDSLQLVDVDDQNRPDGRRSAG